MDVARPPPPAPLPYPAAVDVRWRRHRHTETLRSGDAGAGLVAVHRRVGVLEERLDALAVGGPAGLADARADRGDHVADHERMVEGGADAPGGRRDLVRRAD